MATATIIKVWQDNTSAYVAASVAEGGTRGTVEYVAATPLVDGQGNQKIQAVLKSDLIAAVQTLRNGQLAAPTAIAGISGTVTV